MPINLPPDIEKQVQEAAARQGIDTETFVVAAVKKDLRAIGRPADEATALNGDEYTGPDATTSLVPNGAGRGRVSLAECATAWDVLDALTGTVEAPSDWSSEHDHYLYGGPKNIEEAGSDPQDPE